MHSHDPSSMSLADLNRSSGELTNRLAYSGEYHRRKNRKAAITRQQWKDTGCEYLMTFTDFRQQGRRNRIRKELGLDPIYLPGEGKPNTVH